MRKPSVRLHASKSPSRHYSWETHCHHRNQEWETEKQNNYKRDGRGMWKGGADEEECQSEARATAQNNQMQLCFICLSECVCAQVCPYLQKRKSEKKGIGGGSVAFRPVTYCRCEPCLFGPMGLMGSLFLKLDCTLDERARSPWEAAGSSDKLLEEPNSAGSPSEPR